MGYKVVSFWSAPKPEDEAEFESYYTGVHALFAARVPGTRKLLLTRTSDYFEITPSAFYRVAEMWYDSKAAYDAATETQEWAEMRVDGGYVHDRFGCTLTSGLGEMVDVPLDPSGPMPVSAAAETMPPRTSSN